MGPNQFSDLTLEEFQALPIRGFVKSSERGWPTSASTWMVKLQPVWTGAQRVQSP